MKYFRLTIIAIIVNYNNVFCQLNQNEISLNILAEDYISYGYNDFAFVNPDFERNIILLSSGGTMTTEQMKFMEFYKNGKKKENYWIKPKEESLWEETNILEQDNEYLQINNLYLRQISQSISYYCNDPNQTYISAYPLENDYSRELVALAIVSARISLKYNQASGNIKNKYMCLLQDINQKVNLLLNRHRGIPITTNYLSGITEQERERIINNKKYINLNIKEVLSKSVIHFISSTSWEEPNDKASSISILFSLIGSIIILPIEYSNNNNLKDLANEILKELGEIKPIPYTPYLLTNIYYIGYKQKVIRAENYIIFLIDVSGSMQGNKIDQVKQAVPNIINDFRMTDNAYSLIVYSSTYGCEPKYIPIIIPFTKDNELVKTNIQQLNASGSTPMFAGLEKSYSYASNIPDNSKGMIILLSDGQQNCPTNVYPPLDSITIKCIDIGKKSKILLSTIAFGETDKTVVTNLDKLASDGGGIFIEARDPDVIKGKFRELLISKMMYKEKFNTAAIFGGVFIGFLLIGMIKSSIIV